MRVTIPKKTSRNSPKVYRSSARRKRKVLPKSKTKRVLQDIADADWYLIASRTEEVMSDLSIDDNEYSQTPTAGSFKRKEGATENAANVDSNFATTPKQNFAKTPKQIRRTRRRSSYDPRKKQARFPALNSSPTVGQDSKKALSLKDVRYFLPVTACDSWAYQLCFLFAVTGITDAITRKQIFLKAREISGESHSRCLLGQFTHKQQTFFCARLIEETQRKKSKSRLSLNGN